MCVCEAVGVPSFHQQVCICVSLFEFHLYRVTAVPPVRVCELRSNIPVDSDVNCAAFTPGEGALCVFEAFIACLGGDGGGM